MTMLGVLNCVDPEVLIGKGADVDFENVSATDDDVFIVAFVVVVVVVVFVVIAVADIVVNGNVFNIVCSVVDLSIKSNHNFRVRSLYSKNGDYGCFC